MSKLSKRNRNVSKITPASTQDTTPATTQHVVNDDARITNANVVVEHDASSNVVTNDVHARVLSQVRQRNDETNDAYALRVREIVALLNALRATSPAITSRDAKRVRASLRDRDYYISRIERRASCVSSIIANA